MAATPAGNAAKYFVTVSLLPLGGCPLKLYSKGARPQVIPPYLVVS